MSYFVNLKKANADNERLTAEVERLAAELSTAQAALAERDAAAESCRSQFDATLADLTEKLSQANAHVAKLTAEAKTAGQQAADIAAAQGIPAAQTPAAESGAAVSGAELLAGLNACKTPLDRARYMKANEAALSKLIRK